MDTDLVVLLQVSKVRHVQVIIIHLGFTLATASTTAAEAATAEVTARQQTAHSKQGLKFNNIIARYLASRQSISRTVIVNFLKLLSLERR